LHKAGFWPLASSLSPLLDTQAAKNIAHYLWAKLLFCLKKGNLMVSTVDERSQFFSERLRRRLPDYIRRIFLFGSRARGDAWEGSDYDFAIILTEKNDSIIKTIRDVEVEFLNRFDMLAASLVYSEHEWDERKNYPIGINIRKEGVVI
jgi:predicted nucleotidyltransferase